MHLKRPFPRLITPLVLLTFVLGLFLPILSFATAEANEQDPRTELIAELIGFIHERYQAGEELDAHTAYVLTLAGENLAGEKWKKGGRSLKSEVEALADLLGDNRTLVTYLLATQNADGSFGPYANEYSTAPALQALAAVLNDIPVGEAVYGQVEEAIIRAIGFLRESYRENGYAADAFGFDHRCVEALAGAGIVLDGNDWLYNDTTLKESVVESAYRVAREATSVTDAVYLAKHLNAVYAVAPTHAAVNALTERLLALQQENAGEKGLFGTGSVYAELLVLRVLGQTGYLAGVRQADAWTYINQFRHEHKNVFGAPTGAGWGGFGAPESDTTAQVLTALSYFTDETVPTAVYRDEGLAYLGDIQHPDTAGITHPWDPAFATAETLLALHSLGLDWRQAEWARDSRTKTAAQCLLALQAWKDPERVNRLADMLKNRQKFSDPGRGSFENSVYSDMWAFLALGEVGKLTVINTVYALEYILGKQWTGTGQEDGSWGETWGDTYYADFLSTCQALRSLTHFPGYADNQDITAATEAGIEWLRVQGRDDGSHYHGWDDPLVDTADLILTLVHLGQDPAGAEWSRTVGGQTVSPVHYLLAHAASPGNVFAATQALHALIVLPVETPGDPVPPGTGEPGEPLVTLVGVAVVGKNDELLFGPSYVPLASDNEWGRTALGALDATGIPYRTSDQWRGFITCIAGQCNAGTDGWMFQVNDVVPGVGAADKLVEDGDRIVWWYSTDWTSGGPGWNELLTRLSQQQQEQQADELQEIRLPEFPAALRPAAKAEVALQELGELPGLQPEGVALEKVAETGQAVVVLESGEPLSWEHRRQLKQELAQTPVDLAREVKAEEGALVVDAAARIGLAIPPHALDRDMQITIRQLRADDAVPPVPSGYRPVSAFYAFGPAGTTFSSPITLTLRLVVPPTVKPENLVFARYDREKEAWTALPAVVDPGRGLLVTEVPHFSTFTVLGRETRRTFADVGPNAFNWARDPVEILAGAGIIRGVDAHRFEPARPVTRAELTCLLVRGLELDETADAIFVDVPPGAWYAGAVNAAAGTGLVKGFADGTFRPKSYITRQELAALLVRVLDLDGREPGKLVFTDAAAVSDWARNSVAAAAEAGLLGGYPDGTFRPMGRTTRAEAAAVLYRVLADL